MEDLKGKMMYGFKFSGAYAHAMKALVGKIGVIRYQYDKVCQVQFPCSGIWSYPYPEILDHLVDKEDERTIDEIIIELKQLTSQL